MTSLEQKLQDILLEKEQKIKPENIKKGVNVFDIVGQLDSSNLAMKSGSFTASDYSTVNIEHNCGKMPLIVWTDCPMEIQEQGYNNLAGFFWIKNSLCGTIALNINSVEGAGYPYLSWRKDRNSYSYTVKVDENTIELIPAQKWVKATYTWHAIYEV